MATVMLMLVGCQSKPTESPPDSPQVAPGDITSYVALGDSFSSGPGITPEHDDAGPCQRSTRNYPALLAEDLQIKDLVDVTCVGASTTHVTVGVPLSTGTASPPQMEALSADTDLVTIGIGYNDEGMISKLVGACLTSPAVAAAACRTYADTALAKDISTVRANVIDALTKIRARAKHATVVLVGYLPIVAELDSCPSSLFTPDHERRVYDAERSVDDTLQNAAQEAGTEFVSMRELGRGHGACDGADAWVNDTSPTKGDGVIVHPRAIGMSAVASAVAEHIRTYEE